MATAFANQITNRNFLSPAGFNFTITKWAVATETSHKKLEKRTKLKIKAKQRNRL